MPLQIPRPETALHLYRHLLREATYLPPLFQPWVTKTIKTKFRESCSPRRCQNRDIHIQSAHRQLRFLRAANAGDLSRMQRISFLATGRIGKRRRQLSSEFLSKDPPAESEALRGDGNAISTVKATGHSRRNATLGSVVRLGSSWLDNWDFDKIIALSKTQYKLQSSLWPKQIRKTIDPLAGIPSESIWGRPLALRLLRSKIKKHWTGVLGALMPPLPRGEWEILRALSRGEVDAGMWNIPPRRPVALSKLHHPEPHAIFSGTAAAWERFATQPARHLEKNMARRRQKFFGETDDDPRGPRQQIGICTYKPRLLRRNIYERAWRASPLVTTRPGRHWSATWPESGISDTQISRPVSSELEIFRGVDQRGRRTSSGVLRGCDGPDGSPVK